MRKIIVVGIMGLIVLVAIMSGCCSCVSSGITDVKETDAQGLSPTSDSTTSSGKQSSKEPEIGSYENPVPAGKTVNMTISNGNAIVEYSVKAYAKGDEAFNLLNNEYKKEYTYLSLSPSDTEDYLIIYETLNVISVKNPPVSGYDFNDYSGHITTSKGDAKLMITTVDKYSDGLNCNNLFPGQTLTGYTTLGVPKGTINEELIYYRNIGFKNYYFYL